MIRGVSFKIPQVASNVLFQILNCIDVKRYYWYNVESQNEVWTNTQENVFFETDFYNGADFLKKIHSDHYIVFMKLQAYFQLNQLCEIQTYSEFEKSNCELLILIYDCEFVEIFSKSSDNTKLIYENCFKNGYEDIVFITEKNDGRSSMNVL